MRLPAAGKLQGRAQRLCFASSQLHFFVRTQLGLASRERRLDHLDALAMAPVRSQYSSNVGVILRIEGSSSPHQKAKDCAAQTLAPESSG
jgi:hypothetical protein